ncbi:hypothetical protein [Leptolyngbya sp. BC1307]|uniref:hypothetical protein n=1 Tax=Leptolyngbya sp. BC1307 TaxID=2029589 RepID=UPI000EFC31B5|nr:hypothetical protein [Leptolyngbya sp. BC1307]
MAQADDFVNDLAACYQCLQLQADATLKEVDEAYFRLKVEKIHSGNRTGIDQLKAARETLRQQMMQAAPSQIPQAVAHRQLPTELGVLTTALANDRLTAKASLKAQTLHLGIEIDTALSSSQVLTKVRRCLEEIPTEVYSFEPIETITIYGLDGRGKPRWKKSFAPPQQHSQADDSDLYSFENRYSNTFIFPGLLLAAALLNSVEMIKLLLFGIHIWIHEFGHATVAWLGGHQATPLPFGWTNIGEERSLFVYFGVLTLFGLLFWTGAKEQRRWPMGLAIALTVIQFFMTWVISADTFDMLLSFGGIGGEFYLSTLLIIGFYLPLPAYWRWDFFRYPAVLLAGFTFLGSLWQWRQIDRGLADIPWGTLFGGSDHIGGDMNQLHIVYGWSDQQIIDTYNSIGSVCVVAILSVYIYFFIKERNYLLLQKLWLRSHRKTGVG